MTIDVKDKKILYELDKDARRSYSVIGKKVGLKKDVVAYRINKLEEQGVINNYYTVIDSYRLGYFLFRYYINFQYVNTQVKKEIIEYFNSYRNICTVGSIVGKYDLVVVVWVKNLNDFYQFWNTALNRFGDHFENRIFSVYIRGIGFLQSFLFPDNTKEKTEEIYDQFGVGSPVEIDELDYRLLNELALHARSPLVELAKKLDTSSQTIKYRINKLEKNGVIQGYRVNINLDKIGFKRFKADIYLKEHKQKEKLIKFIKKNPFVIYISTSVGLCDLELELIVESSDKIVEILDEINARFPDVMRNYSFYGDILVYKETFLPNLFN